MRDAIEKVMTEKLEKERLDLALFMLTDITEKGTLLFAFVSVTLRKWFGQNHSKTVQNTCPLWSAVRSK